MRLAFCSYSARPRCVSCHIIATPYQSNLAKLRCYINRYLVAEKIVSASGRLLQMEECTVLNQRSRCSYLCCGTSRKKPLESI